MFTGFFKPIELFKLLGGEIYWVVSWYTFVCFIIHILHNLCLSLSRPNFLEPKWSHYLFCSNLTFALPNICINPLTFLCVKSSNTIAKITLCSSNDLFF